MLFQKHDTSPSTSRLNLGFRLQAFQDARSAAEARQRHLEQGTADRLNGLLDAYEPLLAKALEYDGRDHVDFNAEVGVVAVADLTWPGKVGLWSDETFSVFACRACVEGSSSDAGTLGAADLMHGDVTLLHHDATTGTTRLYSPQEQCEYQIETTEQGTLRVTW